VVILVPPLLGLKGNLEMTLASRLSTQVSTNQGHLEFMYTVNVSYRMWIMGVKPSEPQDNNCRREFVGWAPVCVAVAIGNSSRDLLVELYSFLIDCSIVLTLTSFSLAQAAPQSGNLKGTLHECSE